MSFTADDLRLWGVNMSKARLIIKKKAIYYLATINKFIPVADESTRSAAVTAKFVLYVNARWFASLTPEQSAGTLIHHVHHALRGHPARLKPLWDAATTDKERKIVKWAAELAINDHILDAGWTLPGKPLTAAMFGLPKYKTVEEYVRMLRHLPTPPPEEAEDCEGCGGGSGCGENDSHENDLHQRYEGGRAPRDISDAVKETVKGLATSRGNESGKWSELLEVLETPSKVPWERTLNSSMLSLAGQVIQGGSDYSYERRSRRALCVPNIISPAMVGRQLIVVVVVDTSGSMHADLLNSALSETRNILKRLGMRNVWLVQADTEVAAPPKLVTVNDLTRVTIYGRGGTDFDAPLAAVAAIRPKAHMCVYMTDGDGWITRKPKIPTIFGLIGTRAAMHAPRLRQFGGTVLID